MHLEHISIHFMNQSWEFWLIQPRRERRDHKANRPNNRSQCLKPNAIPIQLFLSAIKVELELAKLHPVSTGSSQQGFRRLRNMPRWKIVASEWAGKRCDA
jgi:hypothetical protein